MPVSSKLHVDQLLSNVSLKYHNAEYIGGELFASVPVKKKSDLYRVYVRNFRVPETKRANKAEANQHDFDITTSSYLLENHALKDYISDDDQDNYDMADLRADTVEELTDVIYRRREKSIADLFTTTNWSLNVSLAAANAFSANTTVSNPIAVYDTACTVVLNNSGFKPNIGFIPREGMVAAKNHLSILDRLKYTSAEVDIGKLAALSGIERFLEANSVVDSSAEGATESIPNMYGDVSWVGYKPARPRPRMPASGYIFEKQMPRVKRWRDEERESEAIEVATKYQPKIVASLSGYLIKDIV